ncbi:MAG: hypothetical protein ACYCQJ_09825 [Nitrososphaerales archaeon]
MQAEHAEKSKDYNHDDNYDYDSQPAHRFRGIIVNPGILCSYRIRCPSDLGQASERVPIGKHAQHYVE